MDKPISDEIANLRSSVPIQFITNHPFEENASLFHQADMFVAAEKSAGLASAVAEAMACGLPVIATRSDTSDTLIDGITGIRIRRNVPSIAKAVSELIESPELRDRIALNGKVHIQKFTWKILAGSIIGWYKEQVREEWLKPAGDMSLPNRLTD